MFILLLRRCFHQIIEKWSIVQQTVFDDLRAAAAVFPLRQRVQYVAVADHERRLPEGPGLIFAAVEVDGGLAADGRIDHGQQRRWQLDEADATQIRCGGEARQIPHHATAERDDNVRPRDAVFTQKVQDLSVDRQIFRAFAVRKYEGDDAEACPLQRGGGSLAIEGEDTVVRDDRRRLCVHDPGSERAKFVQQAVPDQYVIFPRGGDVNGVQCPSTSSLRRRPSSSRAVRPGKSFCSIASSYFCRFSIKMFSSRIR